tara:strand:+ start:253 stop:2460 length:2208 start_codon:yes stop_codon:yes gene_type:complete
MADDSFKAKKILTPSEQRWFSMISESAPDRAELHEAGMHLSRDGRTLYIKDEDQAFKYIDETILSESRPSGPGVRTLPPSFSAAQFKGHFIGKTVEIPPGETIDLAYPSEAPRRVRMADKTPTARELRIAQMKRKLDEAIKNLSAPPAREPPKSPHLRPPTLSVNSLGIDGLGRAHQQFDKYGMYMDEADQLAFRAKLDEAYGLVTDEMIKKVGEQKARARAKTGPDSATEKWLRMVEKRRGAPADAPGAAGVFERQRRKPTPESAARRALVKKEIEDARRASSLNLDMFKATELLPLRQEFIEIKMRNPELRKLGRSKWLEFLTDPEKRNAFQGGPEFKEALRLFAEKEKAVRTYRAMQADATRRIVDLEEKLTLPPTGKGGSAPKTRKDLREGAAARALDVDRSRKKMGTGWISSTPKVPPSFTKFITTGGGRRDPLGDAHIDKLEWRLNRAVSDLLTPAQWGEDMGIENIRNLRGELDAALADGLVSQEDHALLQKKVGEAENLITPDMEKRVGERQARRIEKAEKRLAAAEEQLSSATPGTPEHSKAAKRLDAAKKHLKVLGRLAGTAAGVYEANLLAKDIKDHGVLKGTGAYLAKGIEGTGQLAQLPEKATGRIKKGWEDMGYTGDSLGTLPPSGVSAADTVAEYVGKAGRGLEWTGDKILKGLGIRGEKPLSGRELMMKDDDDELEDLELLYPEYDDEDEPEVPIDVVEDRNGAIREASKRALRKGQNL